MAIKTSNARYIILNKPEYENLPAIPIKSEEGKLWVLSFMSPNDKRLVLIGRDEVASEEFTQVGLWKN